MNIAMPYSCIGSTQTVFSHLIYLDYLIFATEKYTYSYPYLNPKLLPYFQRFCLFFVCSQSISYYLWIILIDEGIHATVILRAHSTCVIVNKKSL
jgi:hypothetical protein